MVLSLVKELTEYLRLNFLNYIKEAESLTDLQAEVQGAAKQNRYRNVDREHSHAAFLSWDLEKKAGTRFSGL